MGVGVSVRIGVEVGVSLDILLGAGVKAEAREVDGTGNSVRTGDFVSVGVDFAEGFRVLLPVGTGVGAFSFVESSICLGWGFFFFFSASNFLFSQLLPYWACNRHARTFLTRERKQRVFRPSAIFLRTQTLSKISHSGISSSSLVSYVRGI